MSKVGFQAFAAGMIVATSVLGGTYLFSNNNKQVNSEIKKTEITEKEVNSFLTKKGKTSISIEEYEQLLAAKSEEVKNQDIAKEDLKKKEIIKYSLTVVSGMTTSEISKLLEQNGIIENAFEFDQYLIKNDYHTRVQLGTFHVETGMDFKQLAEILTK